MKKRYYFLIAFSVSILLTMAFLAYWAYNEPENYKAFPSMYDLAGEPAPCTVMVSSTYPGSAPPMGVISIAGADFTDTESVYFGDIPADTIYEYSRFLVIVRVPRDVESGLITINTSCGSGTYNGFNLLTSSCEAEPEGQALFISEYGEANGNDKYIELYNHSEQTIDLSSYELRIAFNGGTDFDRTIALSGTMASSATYVIANSGAGSDILSQTDLADGALSFNGDDFVGLFYEGTLIDAIGNLGEDPGTGWTISGETKVTKDHQLVRRRWVEKGNPDWQASSGESESLAEWIIQDPFDFDEIGTHHLRSRELFISEYGEGDGYDKYIELFNPGPDTVDLSTYEVRISFQGEAESQEVIALSGALYPEQTWLMAHTSATGVLATKADQTSGKLRFNGDDFVSLYHFGELIDAVGRNEDPGGSWEVAGVTAATKEQVLIRKSRLLAGNSNWDVSAGTNLYDSEWEVKESGEYTDAGTHTFQGDVYELINISNDPVVIVCEGKGLLYANDISIESGQLSYQWYKSTGTAPFSALAESEDFQNVNAQSLVINDFEANKTSQFYCKIYDSLIGCEKITRGIIPAETYNTGNQGNWQGYLDDSWTNCLNWEDGQLPDAGTDVSFNEKEQVVLGEGDTAYCNDLSMDATDFMLGNTAVLEVSGNLTIGADATIFSEKTGGYVYLKAGAHELQTQEESFGSKVTLYVADGSELQLTSDLYLSEANSQLVVKEGGTFRLNAFALYGSGNLQMEDNASIITSSPVGFSTVNIPLTGTLDLSSSGIYQYEGESQSTGTLLPDSIGQLIVEIATDSRLELSKSLIVKDKAEIKQGCIQTNSNELVLIEGAMLEGETEGSCVFGVLKSFDYINNSTAYQSVFGNIGFEINASENSQTLGLVNVIRYSGESHAIVNGEGQSIQRRWDIEVENQPSQSVNATFNWLFGDTNGEDYSSAQVWRREDGGDWERVGVITDMSDMQVSIDVDRFSEWTIASAFVELPVTLRFFKAQAEGDFALLKWQTVSEKQNKGFEVLRSYDGQTFHEIGFVEGAGNSQSVKDYHYLDSPDSARVYYQLRQTDLDGQFSLSPIQQVNLLPNENLSFYVYPNPTFGPVVLVTNYPKEEYKMVITDNIGKVLFLENGFPSELEYKLNEFKGQFATGIYYMKLYRKNGEKATVPLYLK